MYIIESRDAVNLKQKDPTERADMKYMEFS